MRRLAPMIVAAVACTLIVPAPAEAALGVQRTWHGKQIRAYDAMKAGRYGQGVVVAVLDGWVDRSHPDFAGRILQGADCHTGTCTTKQTRDECGQNHGTHVAGTVASSSYGIAPRATLLPVRVLSSDGDGGCTGDADGVSAGIHWAVEKGADVINLSLGPDVPGLGSASAIPSAVQWAADRGVVVIFSAGNADLPVAQSYGDNALVVAATGPSGRLADYSQYGQGVSVAAPGGQPDSRERCSTSTCITSLYPGGQYAVAAGTSMAAPHVAGIAALLLGQRPDRGRQNVVDRITGTARPLAGAGAGLVDATRALGVTAAARPTPRPQPAVTESAKPRPRVIAKRQVSAPTTAAPRPKPRPSRAPVIAAPAPTQASAPAVVAPSPLSALPPPAEESIPLALAGVAGGLAGLAAAAVMLAGLSQPPRRRS